MIAEVQERNIVRPDILRKRIQSQHLRFPATVSKKAEHLGNEDRIVDLALLHVGLPDDNERRPRPALKQSLHCRECNRLMMSHHSALGITSRKKLQEAENTAGNHTQFYEKASMLLVLSPQEVKRPYGSHCERTGDGGAAHVVGVLPPRPRVQHQLPETGELDGTVRHPLVANRVLHPGVGRYDEIAGEPGTHKHCYR